MKTGTKAEHAVIENYINGNLTDAKAGASRLSGRNLIRVLISDYNKSAGAAFAIVDYLKYGGSFQTACDWDKAKS